MLAWVSRTGNSCLSIGLERPGCGFTYNASNALQRVLNIAISQSQSWEHCPCSTPFTFVQIAADIWGCPCWVGDRSGRAKAEWCVCAQVACSLQVGTQGCKMPGNCHHEPSCKQNASSTRWQPSRPVSPFYDSFLPKRRIAAWSIFSSKQARDLQWVCPSLFEHTMTAWNDGKRLSVDVTMSVSLRNAWLYKCLMDACIQVCARIVFPSSWS